MRTTLILRDDRETEPIAEIVPDRRHHERHRDRVPLRHRQRRVATPGGRHPQLVADGHAELDREQAEERRELDHRVHRYRRRVFEGIAHGIPHDRRVVKRRPLFLKLGLDDLLRVVPGGSRVCHEDRLEKPE